MRIPRTGLERELTILAVIASSRQHYQVSASPEKPNVIQLSGMESCLTMEESAISQHVASTQYMVKWRQVAKRAWYICKAVLYWRNE